MQFGSHLGVLSPSLGVLSPFGATKSHRGSPMQFGCHFRVVTIPLCPAPIWCHQIPYWSPVMLLGVTLGLSPSLGVPFWCHQIPLGSPME